MTIKIKVYSDYICPFCFLAKTPFEKAIEGKDVEVEWLPFELRPSPAEQIDPWQDPMKLAGWENYITPMAKKWGVDMKLPHVSPHPYTHLAFEGLHFAKEHGKAKPYNDRVYTAFFQEEQNIGEIDVLTKIAGEVGLDEAAFEEVLVTRKYGNAQRSALQHAYEEAQITAVPTFIIGEERLQGAADQAAFERALNKELQKDESAKGMQCDINGYCYSRYRSC